MIITEIQHRIQNAKDLDLVITLNQSIELFKKKDWVQGFVTISLNMILVIPFIMMIDFPIIFVGLTEAYASANDLFSVTFSQPDVNPIAMVMMFVLYLFAGIVMSAGIMRLKAAFYRICKLKDSGQMGKDDYFYFFKKPYLAKTITLGLAYIGISLIAKMLCIIPVIYVFVPLSYIFVVYAFNPDKSVSEIIKLSFDLGNRKWLMSFGLLIVSGF